MPITLTNNSVQFNNGSLQTSSRFGPAFSAYAASTQSISNNTATKVNVNTERFDTDACYASSRFTPNRPGYYHIQGTIRIAPSYGSTPDQSPIGSGFAHIFKNGVELKRGSEGIFTSSIQIVIHASVDFIVSMNGSTDYIELFGSFGNPDTINYPSSPSFLAETTALTSNFSGYFLRSL